MDERVRSSDGAPEAACCLLLYFLPRIHKMLSLRNIKVICKDSGVNVKYGLREAVCVSSQRNKLEAAVKIQNWLNMSKENKGESNSNAR